MPYYEITDDMDEDEKLSVTIDNAYHDAQHSHDAISILRDCYLQYENDDPKVESVANDEEAVTWIDNYWEYIKRINHGNEPNVWDIGGFAGFAYQILDSYQVESTLESLLYDDYDKVDEETRDLYDRLINIARRYGTMAKMKKNKHQLVKSGDWIQNWVNGKVEMNSFEANGVSFSLDMSSGGGAYSNDDELIYQGKEILVYMGLPFDTDFESEDDEIIYISAYDENMMELWTQPYSIYQVPTFAHAIGKLEDILRNNNIEAKTIKSVKKFQDIHSMIADIRKNNNSLKKEPTDLYGNWSESHFVADVVGGCITMKQSNYFSNDAVASYEGVIHGYTTSTGVNDLHAWMTYNQVSGEISGRAVWGQYEKNYVPNGYVKEKKSMNAFIGEFKEFIKDFSEMIQ